MSAVKQPSREEVAPAVWVGSALEAALRLRAPGMHASTPMVRQLAAKVGRELSLDAQSRALLDVCAQVRDVGMVALPDAVVLATTSLSPAEWELMNRHPVIGAQLLEELPVLSAAVDVVRAHHERWDGDGYPDGRSGEDIPLLSRVIATCDAFVAIASDRPHRRGLGAEIALEHVSRNRGSQFDPRCVDALVAALPGHPTPGPNGTTKAVIPTAGTARAVPGTRRPRGRHSNLASAIVEFDVIPVFVPARERILAAISTEGTGQGELVAAVEDDTGLTVAVLRRAQSTRHRHPIANVRDAVAALSTAEMREVVEALPRTEFPWRTSQLEVLLHRSRLHAQAVARTAARIGRELAMDEYDDIVVAALLHDIGKLVLERALPELGRATDQAKTPEERVRHEQRSLGVDHTSVGGLLIRKWGLPDRLVKAVAEHHTSEADHEVSTYVRLADMIVHHTQGDAIDRSKMLELSRHCGLSSTALRDILFDLPHTHGSRQGRAAPSPLSDRETAVLRVLAEGKVYAAIALQLGIKTSTVRSHLHMIYRKLAVDDRAQAVLRATEMGWL